MQIKEDPMQRDVCAKCGITLDEHDLTHHHRDFSPETFIEAIRGTKLGAKTDADALAADISRREPPRPTV
jgi:hypothetical protein